MVGAGAAIVSLATASTGCSWAMKFVSCMIFPPNKNGRASRRTNLSAARPSGCAAAGGSAPNVLRRLRLRKWAITLLWGSGGPHQSVGDQPLRDQLSADGVWFRQASVIPNAASSAGGRWHAPRTRSEIKGWNLRTDLNQFLFGSKRASLAVVRP